MISSFLTFTLLIIACGEKGSDVETNDTAQDSCLTTQTQPKKLIPMHPPFPAPTHGVLYLVVPPRVNNGGSTLSLQIRKVLKLFLVCKLEPSRF